MWQATQSLPDTALLQLAMARCEALQTENAVLARVLGDVQRRTQAALAAQAARLQVLERQTQRLRGRLLCQTTALAWGLPVTTNLEIPR